MTHDWLYHRVHGNYQIVSCRQCGHYASYLLSGYKPQAPVEECSGRRRPRVAFIRTPSVVAYSVDDTGRRAV